MRWQESGNPGSVLKTAPRLSLADLSTAGIVLTSRETVTIVREVIRQVARGEHPGVPSGHVIRLSASGAVSIEGPVEAGGRPVPRSAQLLESLLPRFDAPPEIRAPGALRLVIARALGTLDLPPYPFLESFADALNRFAAADPQQSVQNLVARWAATPTASPSVERERDDEAVGALVRLEPAPLTVSDIRRARRATGHSLADISEKSRIPVSMLRQLEWGYLYNWPGGLYGRTQLVRYARAAGLDEALVVSTLTPLLDEMGEVSAPVSEDFHVPVAAERPEPPEITIIEVEGFEPEFADEADIQAEDEIEEVLPPFSDAEIVDERIHSRELFSQTVYGAAPRRSRVIPATAAAAAIALAAFGGYWSQVGRQDSSRASETARVETLPTPPAASSVRRPAVPEAAPAAISDRPDGQAEANKGANAVPRGTTATTSPTDQRLEALNGDSLSPAFVSVGTAMFYRGDEGAEGGVVKVGDAARGEVLRITRVVDDNARNFHARPSPDGTQVAFDSDRDGERAVYVADADGHNVRRVAAAAPPRSDLVAGWPVARVRSG